VESETEKKKESGKEKSSTHSSILKSSSGVAFANLASRLLGMLRDICMASFLGGGALMSAWIFVFTIPNMFRRLLGEGALGTVLVPMISHDLHKKNGRELARKNFTLLFALLGIFMSVISLLTLFLCMLILPLFHTESVRLIIKTLPVIMPYSIFVCLSGITAAALNTMKRFFLPALTALLLNIALIAALTLVVSGCTGNLTILYTLSTAVLSAGIIQLLSMLILLKKVEIFHFSEFFSAIKESIFLIFKKSRNPFIKEIWHLLIPGLLGASALQISVLVDRSLALYLGNYAVPALYYSDRIVFITVGIFAVSLGSVLLPDMSRSAAENDKDGMVKTMEFGLRHLMFICIPAMAFTFIFREEVITLLFLRGKFDQKALDAASWALSFYAFGIPFFASVKVLLSGFYSRKDMKTPVRISIACITLNIILNLILMWPLRQGGIALATVISSVVNNTLLLIILKKELKGFKLLKLAGTILKFILISALSLFATIKCITPLKEILTSHNLYIIQGLELIPAALIFAVSYFIISLLLISREVSEWRTILTRKIKG
jgi:putative peptidoglycan lipid II flippase